MSIKLFSLLVLIVLIIILLAIFSMIGLVINYTYNKIRERKGDY